MKWSPCLLLLSLLLCSCFEQPADTLQLSWTLDCYGAVELQPDNSLRIYHGQGFIDVLADGSASGSTFGDASIIGSGLPDLLKQQGLNQLFCGEKGDRVLSAAGQGWLMTGEAEPAPVSLPRPAEVRFGPHGMLSDNFGKCLLEGQPVILYDGQFAQAYTRTGQPAWQFTAEVGSAMLPSADGHHLAVFSSSGGLYVLDGSGQVLWQRRGCYFVQSLGDRLVMLDASAELLCLGWDGSILWQHSPQSGNYYQLLSDPRSPLFVMRQDLQLTAFDRAGQLVWQRPLTDLQTGAYYMSPDGYVFIWRIDWRNGNGLLGQRIEGGPKHDSLWTCIDPQGRELWRYTKMPSHHGNYLPGYGGRLYIYDDKYGKLQSFDPLPPDTSATIEP